MAESIRKVAVLGAGVMGSGIAAHCANAGIPVLLLDIVPPNLTEDEKKSRSARNRFAAGSLEKALKQRPAPFVHTRRAELIEIGNFDDDLTRIAECDWVVEVVKEDMAVKRAIFEKVDKVRKPGTLIASNTSGLSLAGMTEGRSADFKKNFFVTHFFNPVRYMRLLELVSGPDTDPARLCSFAAWAEQRLGKGIVYGKDTPNFIANRIGMFAMMFTINEMLKQNLTLEEVDAIVGPPLGRPKSAAFRTADIVGLDTFMHVAQNCYDNLPKDPWRDSFKIPEFVQKLVKSGKLGDKTGGGFYQKTKEGIVSLDHTTGEYRPQQKVRFDSLGAARKTEDLGEKMRIVVNAEDKAGQFAWPVMAQTLAYAAYHLNDIADDIPNVDRAMQWGFNWEMGPFETWDALGVAETVARMKKDKITVPAWVDEMLATGRKSFYQDGNVWQPKKKAAEVSLVQPKKMLFSALKSQPKKIVEENMGASLVDLGDDILAVEFHTKMNTLDGDIVGMLNRAVEVAEKNYRGLVIANDGENFSAGANLLFIFMEAQNKNWESLRTAVSELQKAAMRLRYSDIPVVAAPFNLTLGGGAEIAMAADAIRAHSELYMGLVEAGVGVIPAGSGSKELLFRMMEKIPDGMDVDLTVWTGKVFEAIAMAKVATSAEEARGIGFLRPSDGITMNRDFLLNDAKQTALGMANAGYVRPAPRKIKVGGRPVYAALKTMVINLVDAGRASPHDGKIANALAKIITGGEVPYGTVMTEEQILKLEEEAFLSLAGEEKSQARMQAMLETGKPLRN